MEVDGRLEVLDVPEAPGGLLDPLNRGVHCFETSISDPVPQVGQDVREVPSEPRFPIVPP